ncbi:MAG TPA: hypothetical protein VLX92_27040 [Kofleriaceae bacterium]|nr:hypothetical protein [Kofleriaceae bacterium]
MNVATDRPRFRQDLVAEPIDDNGTRFIDVADPDSGSVFRFYEVEYSIACAMDGERDVAGLVRWAREELGVQPSASEVQTVISTLGELGYLETAARAAALAAQPAAANAHAPTNDEHLRPGVVVGAPPAASRIEVELGRPGAPAAHEPELPAAPALELGAPGARTPRPLEPVKVDDIPLGASGRITEPEIETTRTPPQSEVSIDLSQHLSVKPDDVKEAVRASQVMRAVDVPPELVEPPRPIEPVKPARPESTPVPKPPVARPEAKPIEAKPAAKPAEAKPAEAKPAAKPVEARPAAKPARPEPTPAPVATAAPQPKPTAPRSTSPLLIGLLVIVVLGAAAFVAWKYLIKKSDATEQASKPVAPPPKPPAPPPPPVETEKLAVDQRAPEELKAPTAGQIDLVAADQKAVKSGEVVARLVGAKPIDTEVGALERDIETRLQADVATAEKERDAAQTAGDKAKITAAEAKLAKAKQALDDKQGKLATKQAELDKYLVRSPADGTLNVVTKAGARVTPADVVARLAYPPTLVATFKSAPGATAGGKVFVTTGPGAPKISCAVTQIDASGTRISCPHDAASEGATVSYVGPDTSAPPPGGEIEMEGSGEGSGSGSAATSAPAIPAPAPTR